MGSLGPASLVALGVVLLAGPRVAHAAPGQIVAPTAGSSVGPDATFVAEAPAGTARCVFFVDDVRIASFTGPGRHEVQRHLYEAGARDFVVKSLDASGSVVDQRSVSFTARGLLLVPGAFASVNGQDALFTVTPVGLPLLAHVVFTADGVSIGDALKAPWTIRRTFAEGGARRIKAKGFDASGALLASVEQTVLVKLPALDLVPPTARGAIRAYSGWSGTVRLNDRTVAMLANARAWLERNGGAPAARASTGYVSQGSYHKGVSASAGTHDGGGVLDLSVSGLDGSERAALVRALREAGFAAWLRTPPAFAYHIHAVAIRDPDLSPQAAAQVRSYFRGRDGLARDGRDPHGGPIVKPWM